MNTENALDECRRRPISCVSKLLIITAIRERNLCTCRADKAEATRDAGSAAQPASGISISIF